MFLANPQLRDLFPVQMDESRSRLLGSIITAIQNIDDPDRLDDYLRGLGRDHRKYHATAAHYERFGRAILESLRDLSDGQWCDEYDDAWRVAYGIIAGRWQPCSQAQTEPPQCQSQLYATVRRGR